MHYGLDSPYRSHHSHLEWLRVRVSERTINNSLLALLLFEANTTTLLTTPPPHHPTTPNYLSTFAPLSFHKMLSLRSVKNVTKASIAARIVAGIPKTASPSMQRAFTNSASRKEHGVPGDPTGIAAIKNLNMRAAGDPGQLCPTLKKFKLDGKVAVVTG
jgi:hypothetical protein